MYDLLFELSQRPEPFSRYTAKDLWTRPHLAKQMLSYHLNQDTDLASRRYDAIDRIVNWIDSKVHLSDKQLCDLGCGPGLYAHRFAEKGAEVTGIDFSGHSIEYAKSGEENDNKKPTCFIQADYLADELPTGFDVVTIIYCDFCVLSPIQRNTLLSRIKNMLKPGGHIIFDVGSTGLFKAKEELTILESNYMDGFWSAGDYAGLQKTFVYKDHNLSLDRYLIAEPTDTWHIFNWFQYFTPENIEEELRIAGFRVDCMAGDLAGKPLNEESDYIGVIASVA